MLARDFNLNSTRWLSLIFEGKNKEYGAYVIRNESSDRHLKALIIVTLFSLLLLYLPSILKAVIPDQKGDLGQITEATTTVIQFDDEIKEEQVIPPTEAPPPPELKNTIQYTAPKLEKTENIKEEELMLTDAEITESKFEVSTVSYDQGSTEGINIADLEGQKVVVAVEPEAPAVFIHVEQMPEFPGGNAALQKWLNDNISYPPVAEEQGIQGTVNLRFVVKPDGTIGDVEIVKGLDPSCDREAQRAVAKLPKFIPGKQNGVAVPVYFSLPVRFRIQGR